MSILSKIATLLTPDTSSNLPPIEFKQLLALPAAERPKLIDVRTTPEWQMGHIQGATHIDISSPDFDRKIDALPKDASYLLYCQSGGRSSSALSRMKSKGFADVKHLTGGMGAWRSAAYPVAK